MKKENKKKEKKSIMKAIKILTIVLVVALISMVGFVGIYVQNKNQIVNTVKDYSLSMALDGARTLELEIAEDDEETSEETTTEETATEEETTEENATEESEEKQEYTLENYENSKKVIEKRLSALNVQEYSIRLNEETGKMEIELPENDDTDEVVSIITQVGKFEIIDTQTEEVLMSNADIKSADVLYNTTTSGTTVYLQIIFNKEGKEKLEEISKTYVSTEDTEETSTEETTDTEETTSEEASEEETTTEEDSEETEEESTEKTITMKIDDEEIMSTSFDEPITLGELDLSVGSATTDTDTLQDYISQAKNVSVVLDSGMLEVDYHLHTNEYILSSISQQTLIYIEIAVAVVACIAIIILIIRFKLNGLISGISFIGLAALYTLILRYTNVVVSLESIVGAIVILVLNYIFVWMLLKNVKTNIEKDKENPVGKASSETYIKYFLRIIPICVMIIALCFVKWVPINSFAMTSFWGLVLIALYNVIITVSLLKIKESK